LTGGSAQGSCLYQPISRGLSEGWSDALAIYLTRSGPETGDVTMSSVISGSYGGIRSKPYSTNMDINPYTLSYVKGLTGPHAIGEYWANTLYEMYAALVRAHGFSQNVMDATQQTGNVIAIQLVIGGMKFQPCNPNLTQARNAILVADLAYYNGAHNCLIWNAFAKRGLGIDSDEANFVDGFVAPAHCKIPTNGDIRVNVPLDS
jgi:extracellular elastinolytic metalloproteinase